jgi:glutamate synthase domain-containing protein 1
VFHSAKSNKLIIKNNNINKLYKFISVTYGAELYIQNRIKTMNMVKGMGTKDQVQEFFNGAFYADINSRRQSIQAKR